MRNKVNAAVCYLLILSLVFFGAPPAFAFTIDGAFLDGTSYYGGQNAAKDRWQNNTVTVTGTIDEVVGEAIYGAYISNLDSTEALSGNSIRLNGITANKSLYAAYLSNSGTSSLAGNMFGNSLIIENAKATTPVYGAYLSYRGANNDIEVSNNLVVINNAEAGIIYGAATPNGTLDTIQYKGSFINNTVNVANSNVDSVYGAYGYDRTSNNAVRIADSSAKTVYGAYGRAQAERANNSVTVERSTVGNVFGAYQSYLTRRTDSAGSPIYGMYYASNLKNNSVSLNNTRAEDVYGAYNQGWGNTCDNIVTIKNGTVNSVTGANLGINNALQIGINYATAFGTESVLNGNKISLFDTNVNNSVIGGNVESRYYQNLFNITAINNNEITISNVHIGQDLLGGFIGANLSMTPADIRSGNTLNVYKLNNRVGGHTGNFENYNFILPANVKNRDVMLYTDTADIDNAKIGWVIEGGATPLVGGDMVYLIKANDVMDNTFVDVTPDLHIKHGVSLYYDDYWMGLIEDDKSLVVKLPLTPKVNPQTKVLSEGWLSGVATVNGGSDLIAGAGMDAMLGGWGIFLDDDEPTYVPFAIMDGGYSRYQTGSYIDLNTLHMMGGIGFRAKNTRLGDFYFAPFLEAGWASYKTHNDFDNFPVVDGRGHVSYFGGGAMGRWEKRLGQGNVFAEGSFHLGNLYNDYYTEDLKDGFGRHANYEANTPYHAYHLGLGYLYEVSETHRLDIYAKYYMTRVYGRDVDVLGDPIVFEDVTSKRLRAGARWLHEHEGDKNWYLRSYIGGAYEREFDGKLHATAYGYDMPRPALTGDTGMAELGIKTKHLPSNVSLDLNIQGFAGTRSGYQGNVTLKWEF